MEHRKIPSPPDRSLKRRQTEDDLDDSNKQAGNTGSSKRSRIQNDLRDKHLRTTKDEDNEAAQQLGKSVDKLIKADKKNIEHELQSNMSVLILERSPTWKAHCQARFCIPRRLKKRPNIESPYRFNLVDLADLRAGRTCRSLLPGTFYDDLTSAADENRYYHISCIEQIFDLVPLIQPKYLMMKGGATLVGMFRNALQIERLHPAIEDWFDNGGRSYSVEELARWDKIFEEWESKSSSYTIRHQIHEGKGQLECNCEPVPEEPKKSDYFPQDRTPRLLSEVLASIRKVDQIDNIPQSILDELAAPSSDEENENSDSSNDKKPASDSAKKISEDVSPIFVLNDDNK
jgi:hypothetical protein